MAHDNRAGENQGKCSAAEQQQAGRGQVRSGKAVLKALLVAFHMERRLRQRFRFKHQLRKRHFFNGHQCFFHDRPSRVLASVSTRLTGSTRTTPCG